MKSIKKEINFSNNKKKLNIKCIPVMHGSIESLSFIINNTCAYISDANKIYQKKNN